jgi:DNA-binding MarR family transcriptional regulator
LTSERAYGTIMVRVLTIVHHGIAHDQTSIWHERGSVTIKEKRVPPSVMDRLGIAFLTWRRYLQRKLVPHGITLKQAFVLRQLVKRDFLYPSQIARLLFCDRPTATVIVRNMERQGWVTRRKDTENQKYVRVNITERGKEKLAEIRPHLEITESSFDPLACCSEKEMEELEKLLTKLNKHLSAIRQED